MRAGCGRSGSWPALRATRRKRRRRFWLGWARRRRIDLLRILWPTGVLQDEIDLPHTQVIAMKEADRRGSSCPVLFAWDGHRYKFVTDVIGAAVVGHWFTPARRNIPNPGEWIKMDGGDVGLVNGKVSVRFMEPMEEVNYIDQLAAGCRRSSREC